MDIYVGGKEISRGPWPNACVMIFRNPPRDSIRQPGLLSQEEICWQGQNAITRYIAPSHRRTSTPTVRKPTHIRRIKLTFGIFFLASSHVSATRLQQHMPQNSSAGSPRRYPGAKLYQFERNITCLVMLQPPVTYRVCAPLGNATMSICYRKSCKCRSEEPGCHALVPRHSLAFNMLLSLRVGIQLFPAKGPP